MKKIVIAIVCLLVNIQLIAQNVKAEEVCYNPNLVKDSSKKSIKSMALGVIGHDTVKVTYHSPGVRGRILWGGLVPFEEVWVTGAHNATNFISNRDFVIGGKIIPAGKYALFTIPGKEEWIVILNKQWDQHLATEYEEKDDVVRVVVKPKLCDHTERLQYFVSSTKGNQGLLAMQWEKVRIELPFELK